MTDTRSVIVNQSDLLNYGNTANDTVDEGLVCEE